VIEEKNILSNFLNKGVGFFFEIMKKFSLLPILICSFALAMIIISFQNKNICKATITMNDGTKIEARKFTQYKFGITDIIKCSGERIQVPNQTIKKIKYANSTTSN